MLVKQFAEPCRIDYVPSPLEPNEDGVLDVGWRCGALSDGRGYRLECWRMDELVMVTVLFASKGLTGYNRDDMYLLLEAEDIVKYTGGKRPLQMACTQDDAGSDMWALNIMLSRGEMAYASVVGELRRYR